MDRSLDAVDDPTEPSLWPTLTRPSTTGVTHSLPIISVVAPSNHPPHEADSPLDSLPEASSPSKYLDLEGGELQPYPRRSTTDLPLGRPSVTSTASGTTRQSEQEPDYYDDGILSEVTSRKSSLSTIRDFIKRSLSRTLHVASLPSVADQDPEAEASLLDDNNGDSLRVTGRRRHHSNSSKRSSPEMQMALEEVQKRHHSLSGSLLPHTKSSNSVHAYSSKPNLTIHAEQPETMTEELITPLTESVHKPVTQSLNDLADPLRSREGLSRRQYGTGGSLGNLLRATQSKLDLVLRKATLGPLVYALVLSTVVMIYGIVFLLALLSWQLNVFDPWSRVFLRGVYELLIRLPALYIIWITFYWAYPVVFSVRSATGASPSLQRLHRQFVWSFVGIGILTLIESFVAYMNSIRSFISGTALSQSVLTTVVLLLGTALRNLAWPILLAVMAHKAARAEQQFKPEMLAGLVVATHAASPDTPGILSAPQHTNRIPWSELSIAICFGLAVVLTKLGTIVSIIAVYCYMLTGVITFVIFIVLAHNRHRPRHTRSVYVFSLGFAQLSFVALGLLFISTLLASNADIEWIVAAIMTTVFEVVSEIVIFGMEAMARRAFGECQLINAILLPAQASKELIQLATLLDLGIESPSFATSLTVQFIFDIISGFGWIPAGIRKLGQFMDRRGCCGARRINVEEKAKTAHEQARDIVYNFHSVFFSRMSTSLVTFALLVDVWLTETLQQYSSKPLISFMSLSRGFNDPTTDEAVGVALVATVSIAQLIIALGIVYIIIYIQLKRLRVKHERDMASSTQKHPPEFPSLNAIDVTWTDHLVHICTAVAFLGSLGLNSSFQRTFIQPGA